MIHNRKRELLFITLIISIIIGTAIHSADTVLAGSINGNESSVISAARGTFQFEGKVYVAGQEHIQSLISKLSEDDVDLTAAQASELINEMYGNIRRGVDEGYLIPAQTAGGEEEDPDSSGESNNNSDQNTTSGGDNGTINNQNNGNDDTTDTDNTDDTDNNTEDLEVIPYNVPAVIKETGFSYLTDSTLLCLILLTILFSVCMIMSIKICVSKKTVKKDKSFRKAVEEGEHE
ncbi:MAG: hypothetical protein LBR68_04500 [Lachnoclostridium sp.]|nr:hypothetical protein [Lachnoclostridium sp.]